VFSALAWRYHAGKVNVGGLLWLRIVAEAGYGVKVRKLGAGQNKSQRKGWRSSGGRYPLTCVILYGSDVYYFQDNNLKMLFYL
jgi:hypothetical protein